jgi:uncharacterized membrane protein
MSSIHLPQQQTRQRALWLVLAFFAAGVVLPNFPQYFPRQLMAAAQAIPAVAFTLIHGANAYRWRGISGFVAISLAVGYLAEALGVHTAFPFGHYYFTNGMGPQLFDVPILMGPAYVGMGYISWTVARVICSAGTREIELNGARLIALPLAASFVMVAWDIAIDPVLSTFAHYWVWVRGGAFFGVPLSNFLGWYATNYLIYQLFVFYLRKRAGAPGSSSFGPDRLAIIFYAVCAAGIVLRSLNSSDRSIVIDPAGVAWRISDINAASTLAAIFIMGAFVALALVKLNNRHPDLARPPFASREDFDKSEITFSQQDEFEQAQ